MWGGNVGSMIDPGMRETASDYTDFARALAANELQAEPKLAR